LINTIYYLTQNQIMPKTDSSVEIVSEEVILENIYLIRGQEVMLDRDLTEMYGLEVKRLN